MQDTGPAGLQFHPEVEVGNGKGRMEIITNELSKDSHHSSPSYFPQTCGYSLWKNVLHMLEEI